MLLETREICGSTIFNELLLLPSKVFKISFDSPSESYRSFSTLNRFCHIIDAIVNYEKHVRLVLVRLLCLLSLSHFIYDINETKHL